MRFAWSDVRQVSKLPRKKVIGFVALLSLVWVAPALSHIRSTALLAEESTGYGSEWEDSETEIENGEANYLEPEGYPGSGYAELEENSELGYAELEEYVELEEYSEPEYSELEEYAELEEYVEPEYSEPAGYFEPATEPEYDESIAPLDYESYENSDYANYEASAIDAENEAVPPENTENRRIPPPEPTEWIAAWVDDLKQSSERWIEVDLANQQLLAWEGNTVVFSAPVSTGREGDWTPPGVYAIETKYDKAWMQGDDYDIPNVPYVMYFFGSYAIHGAYWRDSFGTPASRGCVSMSVEQAEWLYSWATEGTHVVIER